MSLWRRLLGIPEGPPSTNGHAANEDPDRRFYTSPLIFSGDIALAVPGEFVVTRSPADSGRPSAPRARPVRPAPPPPARTIQQAQAFDLAAETAGLSFEDIECLLAGKGRRTPIRSRSRPIRQTPAAVTGHTEPDRPADRATQRAYARQLRAQGKSTTKIAKMLGVSQATAWRWTQE